jgi:nanoRNase/pAp phosphatase (c-di-AMP/oligoRNAs hydrolase)
VNVSVGDLHRTDTYLKADLTPTTCVLVEDNGRPGIRKILAAVRDAGGTLVYVIGMNGGNGRREDDVRGAFPEVSYLSMAELVGGPLVTQVSRSLTRARVQQYQRYFSDGDRVLILLHNDPDPDAMASGLALRNILRRTKATAILGALQGVTRPENLRMANLLDIQVEAITPASLGEFERIAVVDVQPHYFGELLDRVDLVIDHHPPQPGYSAVFKDIRADYGSTSTILTEHLRAVDVNISERTATALLYAIKSDTLFFNRQANRVDLEAFSFLYPLADAALIRKMEGAEITFERLDHVIRAVEAGRRDEQVFAAFIGQTAREDLIAYVADFFLQLEDVKWTLVAGVVNDMLVMSIRNLGYQRNAGEFSRKWFADIGSAGGHRAMAKAVVPIAAFRAKFGALEGRDFSEQLLDLAVQFLREHAAPEKKKEAVKA